MRQVFDLPETLSFKTGVKNHDELDYVTYVS